MLAVPVDADKYGCHGRRGTRREWCPGLVEPVKPPLVSASTAQPTAPGTPHHVLLDIRPPARGLTTANLASMAWTHLPCTVYPLDEATHWSR